ncbi:hypothetical protein C1645_738722 [Glomus cerebriforme]|uniref:Uncharacterized protein n=1 Tax=Glomus cerebriforme TaxID=658196 RepID=A0A397SUD4_9GLOM|nr:hypothetical protein C1645_738722 [Glomus cerebriforme]
MELTENELLDQELNFDWNNSNNSYSYNIFPYNSQETHEDQQQSNKILDAVPNSLQRPRVMTDLLAQSNLLSTYLSQSNIAECINLQNKKRDEEHLCSNHTKPTNKYDLSTLFDCVLTPRTVDYNKLLTRIDNIVQHLSNLYNHQNDIMNVKEELNALRETISNQINMHEEASEKRIEEIFTRLCK